MTRAAVIIALILAATWAIWSVFVALGVLLVVVALALVFSPFVLSGNLSEAEDNAIGDWPTIIDMDEDE